MYHTHADHPASYRRNVRASAQSFSSQLLYQRRLVGLTGGAAPAREYARPHLLDQEIRLGRSVPGCGGRKIYHLCRYDATHVDSSSGLLVTGPHIPSATLSREEKQV